MKKVKILIPVLAMVFAVMGAFAFSNAPVEEAVTTLLGQYDSDGDTICDSAFNLCIEGNFRNCTETVTGNNNPVFDTACAIQLSKPTL